MCSFETNKYIYRYMIYGVFLVMDFYGFDLEKHTVSIWFLVVLNVFFVYSLQVFDFVLLVCYVTVSGFKVSLLVDLTIVYI